MLIRYIQHVAHIQQVNSSAWLRLDASEGAHVDERKA